MPTDGVSIVVVDWDQLRHILDGLDAQNDFSVPLDRCGMELERSVDVNFQAGGSPTAWEQLRPLTLSLRQMGGRGAQILQDSGRLKQSVTWRTVLGGLAPPDGAIYTLSTMELDVGTNLPYAAIQQFGGKISVTNKRVLARKIEGSVAKQVQGNSSLPLSTYKGDTYAIFGRTVTIVPRPYLVVQDEDDERFGEVFVDWEIEQIENLGGHHASAA